MRTQARLNAADANRRRRLYTCIGSAPIKGAATRIVGAALLAVFIWGCQSVAPSLTAPVSQPPIAKKIPHITTIHGERLVDNYYWLRNKNGRDVRAYLNAENAYTDRVMKPAARLQDKLYNEFLSRAMQTDEAVPYRDGGYFYYTRMEGGKGYSIYCRKKGNLGAPEEIILDVNELAKGKDFLNLGLLVVSDDGTRAAYTTDLTGFGEFTLYVKNLRTGKLLAEKIPHVDGVAWAADNQTLFYVTEDKAKRPFRLWRHTLAPTKSGQGAPTDTLLYEEKNELFSLGVGRSHSKQFLFATSDSMTSSEVRFLLADHPTGSFQLIAPRAPDQQYYVDHRGDQFYIRVNDTGRNFRIVTAPVAAPDRKNWREFVPQHDEVMLEGLELFADYYVLLEREDGLPQMRVTEFAGGQSHRIKFRDPTYAVGPDNNPEFHSRFFRFTYESLATPSSVYDYDMSTGERKLLKQEIVKGGYDPSRYICERIFATASDGTRIPISLVYRLGLKRDGSAPLHLNGYGAYGLAEDAEFAATRLSLLDRGIVCAIAHVRGGGELGKKWHEAGRMMNKRNTFTDYIACAEHLIAQGYTSKGRIVAEGASAGGLLMGAVLNMRPDMFKAALLEVPFVDVIDTMLDESLPLTVGEFEEWGNPKIKEQYDYIKSYSPYDNISAQDYPAMLVETSLNDSLVMFWEPAKYVAKLRVTKTDNNSLLLKVTMAGGHNGKSGRYDSLHDLAFEYAFILTQLGLDK